MVANPTMGPSQRGGLTQTLGQGQPIRGKQGIPQVLGGLHFQPGKGIFL